MTPELHTSIDLAKLREAFGTYMTGVTVVTTRLSNGQPIGFTANSFTSVSLRPPLLLVCPGKHLSHFEDFHACTHFAINVLGEDQQSVAHAFASDDLPRFVEEQWGDNANGVPVLSTAAASFSCQRHDSIEAGDHTVLIGRVTDFAKTKQHGLGYWSGGYFSLGREYNIGDTGSESENVIACAIIVYGQAIYLLTNHGEGYSLPHVSVGKLIGTRTSLSNYLEEVGLDVTLGPVYAIYDNSVTKRRFIVVRAIANSDRANDLGEFVQVDKIQDSDLIDPTEVTIIRRFISELAANSFGLYVGDESKGDVYATGNS